MRKAPIRSVVLASAMLAALASGMVNSGAAGGDPAKPTWWAKYQYLAAHPAATGGAATQSVAVGANVDISNEPTPQSETAIAINPKNPAQIMGGSNEIVRDPMRAYYSADGGTTWTGSDLPLPPARVNNGFDFGSDPGVAWDNHDNVYYSYIVVFFGAGGGLNGTEMAVAHSSNGGLTWAPTYFAPQTGTAQFNDKPMITVDNRTSPSTVYVSWDNVSGANGKASSTTGVLLSSSRDGGVTFSSPTFVSSQESGPKGDIASQPFAGPDSTLYVAWHNYLTGDLDVASSSDRGASFGPTHLIHTTQAKFDVAIPAQNSRRALIYPACGADNQNRLTCSWTDVTASNGMDAFVASSADGGMTWSAPVRVNDDAEGVATDQFNQWLSIDPVDQSVNLSWNDTRNDPTHLSTDIFYARSTNGGQSFGANVQVTTAPTNETCCGADPGNQYGDYEGIAAFGGDIHPIWTDRRAAVAALDEEIFSATITVK